eukprot:293870-Alexandrium_andersonii.AAC.1
MLTVATRQATGQFYLMMEIATWTSMVTFLLTLRLHAGSACSTSARARQRHRLGGVPSAIAWAP